MTSTQDNRIRKTAGLIDGNGFYQSRATSGGDWVFAASPALTDEGQPSDAATPRPPYHLSDSAVVRAQTRFILDQYTEAYRKLDSTFENVTQLEQYITLKAHADGYLETSRGPGFLERRRPGSCLLQTGTFFPQGDVITALPIAYTNASGFTKDITTSGLMYVQPNTDRGETYEDEGPFSEVVMAGPYVFCTLWASDYETGVHPDVKVEEWVWWGNEMRSEATWAVAALDRKLEAGGTTSDQVVHCTAFLNDLGDLYELDQVWKRKFPESPPARTLLPVRGQGSPRREGAVTHADGAMKMEIQIRALRPGYGAEREVVSTGAETVGYQAEAVRAGELLWISGTFAGDPGGLRSGPGTPAQVDYILERFGEICGAAGTDLQNLLRLRAYVTDASDGYHVHSGVRNAIRREPPCVAVSEVRGPLQLPGATVMMDAIAWIP